MTAAIIMISAIVLAVIAISACIRVTIQTEREEAEDQTPLLHLIDLEGVNLRNPDGVLIQDVISMANAGDDVLLRRGEYKGSKSVRVDSYYGTIGFLPRHEAYLVTDLIESGTLGEAKVEKIQPSQTGYSKGVTISVGVEELKVIP